MKRLNHVFKKTTLTVALIILCVIVSSHHQVANAQSEKEMKAMIERVEEIWNKGDLARIEEIFSPDLVRHDINNVVDTMSIDDYKEWVTSIRTTYPDFTVKTEQLIIKDDIIVWHMTMTGKHNGTSGDSPFTGKKIKLPGVSISRVVNGKIAEAWHFWNWALALKQLGYTFTPPSTKSEK